MGSKSAEGGEWTENATFVLSLHYKNDRNSRGAEIKKKMRFRRAEVEMIEFKIACEKIG